LAEAAGRVSPDRMQRLPRAQLVWTIDGVEGLAEVVEDWRR
jgi:hypothetical protein